MKKILFLLLLPFLLIPAYAQQDTGIPSWVKVVAGAWANDEITDSNFQNTITFLIDNGIIQIDITSHELEIDTKNSQILILEREIQDIGLDNSKLLLGVVEGEKQVDFIQDQFEEYKIGHAHKVGNIGGATIDANTVFHLQERIQGLEQTIEELKEELR